MLKIDSFEMTLQSKQGIKLHHHTTILLLEHRYNGRLNKIQFLVI